MSVCASVCMKGTFKWLYAVMHILISRSNTFRPKTGSHQSDIAPIVSCGGSVFVCGHAKGAASLCNKAAETFKFDSETPMNFYVLCNITKRSLTAVCYKEL